MTDYRYDTGGCPQITYDGDTVTIVETANPGQMVVTPAAKWDAYLDTIRAQERKRIVAAVRHMADTTPPISFDGWANKFRRLADLLESGEFDLAADDE